MLITLLYWLDIDLIYLIYWNRLCLRSGSAMNQTSVLLWGTAYTHILIRDVWTITVISFFRILVQNICICTWISGLWVLQEVICKAVWTDWSWALTCWRAFYLLVLKLIEYIIDKALFLLIKQVFIKEFLSNHRLLVTLCVLHCSSSTLNYFSWHFLVSHKITAYILAKRCLIYIIPCLTWRISSMNILCHKLSQLILFFLLSLFDEHVVTSISLCFSVPTLNITTPPFPVDNSPSFRIFKLFNFVFFLIFMLLLCFLCCLVVSIIFLKSIQL